MRRLQNLQRRRLDVAERVDDESNDDESVGPTIAQTIRVRRPHLPGQQIWRLVRRTLVDRISRRGGWSEERSPDARGKVAGNSSSREVFWRNGRLGHVDGRQRERHVGWRHEDLETAHRELSCYVPARSDLRGSRRREARQVDDRHALVAKQVGANARMQSRDDGECDQRRVGSNAGDEPPRPRPGRGADSMRCRPTIWVCMVSVIIIDAETVGRQNGVGLGRPPSAAAAAFATLPRCAPRHAGNVLAVLGDALADLARR